MDFKEELLKYENNRDDIYLIKNGTIPVILTAPHTMEQVHDDGSIKLSEPFTSAIVQYVANKLNCSYLIKLKDTGLDANRFNETEFKDMLIDMINKNNIKLAIDIHGAKKDREFDVEFGTLSNLSTDFSTIRELEDAFRENGIKNIEYNNPFKGGAITQTVYSETNIDVVQIEINGNYRNIDDPEKIKKICDSLIDFIKQFSNYN